MKQLRTMNDVRKWLGDAMDGTRERSVNRIDGYYTIAIELLNLIGRDAAPEPWEEMAHTLANELESKCADEDFMPDDTAMILAAYRKLKEASHG